VGFLFIWLGDALVLVPMDVFLEWCARCRRSSAPARHASLLLLLLIVRGASRDVKSDPMNRIMLAPLLPSNFLLITISSADKTRETATEFRHK
jgi:hypothetical protein